MSLNVRTSTEGGIGFIHKASAEAHAQSRVREGDKEFDYAEMLNRVLTDDIRVLSWAPVPHHFDARFD